MFNFIFSINNSFRLLKIFLYIPNLKFILAVNADGILKWVLLILLIPLVYVNVNISCFLTEVSALSSI